MTDSRGVNIAKTVLIVIVLTFLGQMFGYVREMLIAARFGANAVTDAFFVAYLIPYYLNINLFIGGAFAAAFIPVFTQYLNKRREDSLNLAFNSFLWLLFVSLIIALVCAIGGTWVIKLIAPGLTSGAKHLAGTMLQIMSIMVLLNCVSGFIIAYLNSLKKFIAPALTMLLLNIAVVGSILVLAGKIGIYSVVIGIVSASLLQLVLLAPMLTRKIDLSRGRLGVDLFHPGVKEVNGLLIILGASTFISQFRIILERVFASSLDPGTITQLQFAFKVYSIPLALFATPLAVILLPYFSEEFSRGGAASLRSLVSRSMRIVLVLTVPCMFGFAILSLPLIRVLFQHGNFAANSSIITARALATYAIGLSAQAVIFLIMQAYYAIKDMKTPLKVSLFGVFSYMLLGFYLAKIFGVAGIALSYAVTNILIAGLLVWKLSVRLGGLGFKDITKVGFKILVASASMAMVLVPALHFLWEPVRASGIWQAGLVFGLIAVGVIVYLGVCIAFGIEELNTVWQMAVNKIRPRPHMDPEAASTILSKNA